MGGHRGQHGGGPRPEDGPALRWAIVEANMEEGPRGGGPATRDCQRAAGRFDFDLEHIPSRRGREASIYKMPWVTGNLVANYHWLSFGNRIH